MLSRVRSYYAPDPRALSLMRIGVAMVALADLFIRWSDLSAFYSEDGIVNSHLGAIGLLTGAWSFHFFAVTHWQMHCLFFVHMLILLALLAGYRTQLTSLGAFLFALSLGYRNIYINQAGDDLLRLVLLWGVFLNWGECFSIDRLRGRKSIFRPIGEGYLWLIASVYLFTFLLKSSSEWRVDGSAVYYALSLDQIRLPGTGDWLFRHPSWLPHLTKFVYGVECVIPFLVLLPSRSGTLRGVAFILILLLHIGIGMTLYVGLFYIISIVSAIGLIPGKWLDKIGVPKIVINTSQRPNILVNLAAILIVVLSTARNLSTVPAFPFQPVASIRAMINSCGLDQNWGMFSPGVLKSDGWFVFEGVDKAGKAWDLRKNSASIDFERPANVYGLYRNDRWRKLAENIQGDGFTFLRPAFCQFTLREWNKKNARHPMSFMNFYYMQSDNLPDYKKSVPVKHLFSNCNAS